MSKRDLAKSFEKFCPKCEHFQQETGICKKFYFNARDYPNKFIKKCNGDYFKAASDQQGGDLGDNYQSENPMSSDEEMLIGSMSKEFAQVPSSSDVQKSSKLQNELLQLKSELEEIKATFEQKLDLVNHKLRQLEESVGEDEISVPGQVAAHLESESEATGKQESEPAPTTSAAARETVIPEVISEVTDDASEAATKGPEFTTEIEKPVVPPVRSKEQVPARPTKKQGPVAVPLIQVAREQSESLPQAAARNFALEFVIGPFAWLSEYFTGIYTHFKKENKLTEFFLTVGGIAALLFGFGFMLQYSFANYIGEAGKVGLGFLSGIGIVYLGTYFIKKKEDFADYGSSLIGLGVSLNYLCIYFLSSYYGLSSPRIGFLLIIVNTAAAVLLSLRYETKIVAVITLLGGAFAPAYLESSGDSAPFYFSYLWLLCAASVFLARRISWPRLSSLSFLVGFGIIEFSLPSFPENLSWVGFTIVFHGFAYLYIFDSLFAGARVKQTLRVEEIFTLTSAVALFLFNQFFVLEDYFALGVIYLANALPFLLFAFDRRLSEHKEMRATLLLVSGSFIAFAIPALFNRELMGLFWAQEALVLVYCGFLFRFSIVRREGYLLTAIALVRIALSIPEIAVQWHTTLFTSGYLNLVVLGGTLYGLKKLVERNSKLASDYERKMAYTLDESLSFWFAALFMITCSYYLGDWVLNLSVILLFALTYRGHKLKLPLTEYLGLMVYFMLFIQIFDSVAQVDSFSFNQQTLAGKIAILQAFAILWLMQFYYQKLMAENRFQKTMTSARELFYLLVPLTLFVLPRQWFGEYLILTWWGAVVINFILSDSLKHASLRTELFLLVFLASVLSLMEYAVHNSSGLTGSGFYAMTTGLLVLTAMLFYKGGHKRRTCLASRYRDFFEFTFYYAGLYLFMLLGKLVDNPILSLFGTAFYFLVLVQFKSSIYAIRRTFQLAHRIAQLLLIRAYYLLILASVPIAIESHFWQTYLILCSTVFILFRLLYYPNALYSKLPVKGGADRRQYWLLDLHILHLYIIGAYLYVGSVFYSVIAGAIVLLALFFYQNGFKSGADLRANQQRFFGVSFYYVGAYIFFATLKLSNHYLPLSLLMSACYFLVLVRFKTQLYPLRKSFQLVYRIAHAAIIYACYLNFTSSQPRSWAGLVMFATLAGSLYLLFELICKPNSLYYQITGLSREQTRSIWKIDVHLFHLYVMMAYVYCLSFMGDWIGPLMTILLVAHGVTLLFQTLEKRLAVLNRFAVLIFLVATSKLMLHDLNDFSLVEKVIVTMVLGVVLLISAYGFRRLKLMSAQIQ